MAESWKSTLERWLTENRADTRGAGPPGGGRYAASFARVWDEILSYVGRQPRWRIVHADETGGIVTVACHSRVFRLVDDLTVWVSLDREGFTRVEARSRARVGRGDLGVNRRRIVALIGHLDATFGTV
jgi:uncharacterized protein (DUF1499 family)